nr:MAG TPA: hypothetical protein [Bacteriophage sp.]
MVCPLVVVINQLYSALLDRYAPAGVWCIYVALLRLVCD